MTDTTDSNDKFREHGAGTMTAEAGLITCRECGQDVPMGHRFCGHCGTASSNQLPLANNGF